MNIKEQLIEKLKSDYNPSLGELENQIEYLKEEFKEFDLSDGWSKLDILEPQNNNNNNILMYWLLGKAPIPKQLLHFWSGGDFPDIDLDFEPEARDKIKDHLRERFGKKKCMEVVTLGGTALKGAIQDLSRIENMTLREQIDARRNELKSEGKDSLEITKMIEKEFPDPEGLNPQNVNKVTTGIHYNVNNDEENDIDYIRKNNRDAKEFLDKYIRVYDNVRKMQNIIRGIGTHASAFIVSSVDIDEYIPIILNKEKKLVTGYGESSSVKALDHLGLIKFDILGLENLTVNRQTEDMIYERTGDRINWEKIDIDDPEIYSLVNRGYTAGVFQIDSPVAQMIISVIQPSNFEDLSALNALIRPSCLQAKSHEAYKNHKTGKFNRSKFPVWKDLEGKVSDFTYALLDDTYGIPIYQEQIMALMADFCGVHMDETNKLRKLIGTPANKMKPEDSQLLNDIHKTFTENGAKMLGSEEAAEAWWDAAVGSASYGFNRSHSVAYSMVAFRQLYLKKYYPKEFYCALLQTEVADNSVNSKGRLMKYIVEAKSLGVPVISPDINKSKIQLDYHDDTIYIGFEQVKGIGPQAAIDIEARKPYISFVNFIETHQGGATKLDGTPWGRSGVNKTVIEALIVTNAFRDFGTRQEILEEWFNMNLPKTRRVSVELPDLGKTVLIRAKVPDIIENYDDEKMATFIYTVVKEIDGEKIKEQQTKELLDNLSTEDLFLIVDAIRKGLEFEKPNELDILLDEHKALSTVLSVDNPLQLPFGYTNVTKAIDSKKGAKLKIKGVVQKKEQLVSKSSGNKFYKIRLNDLENTATIFVWRTQSGQIRDIESGDIIQVFVKHMEGDAFSLEKVIKIDGRNQDKEVEDE